jgi:predicted nucleic acid-binding protein
MREYQDVLNRPKMIFHNKEAKINEIIDKIKTDGLCVIVKPGSVPFSDESDRVFYDVATACEATLVT